jgi:hypothetical protein
MSLNKTKLENGLNDAFKQVQEKTYKAAVLGSLDASKKISSAIVDYAKDAEVIVTVPPLTPAAPSPIPQTAVIGKKVKVKTAMAGKLPLQGIIFSNFELDSLISRKFLLLFSAAIVVYAATSFTVFSKGSIMGSGAAIMSLPPFLQPATKKGEDGGGVQDVVKEMANIIHKSFKATMFTGIVIAGSAVIPAPLVGTLQ